MNLTAKYQALTQREKILVALLGITVLLTACVYVYPLIFTGKTTGPLVSAPPPKQIKPVVVAEMPTNNSAGANIKNPFRVPPGYEVVKDIQPAGYKPNGPGGFNSPAPKTAQITPVLNGIVTSGATKMAIIELAGESNTLEIGGIIGVYTVTSISGSQVTVKGPDGNRVLNLGGDLH